MKVEEIAKITKGKLLSGDPNADIDPSRISTDSRTVKRGEFFIALRGPNFDGSDFIEDAFSKGAIGVLAASYKRQIDNKKTIIIETKDTLKALQDIAQNHRQRFNIPIIGVTGSNGKTATKEMIWSILSTKYNVLRNEGTKNNHIGVPQTLLKLKRLHDICVLEMGMNHLGEIRLLSRIARPTIAVITNIGPSHLEFLSGLESILKAKKEILEELDRSGTLVINGDDELLARIKSDKFKILRFGFERANDFKADNVSIRNNRIEFLLNSKTKFELNLLGIHNVYNALASIAAASRFNIDYESMQKTLSSYKPSYMRLNIKNIEGLIVIDDSYNSNPLSMKCALDALKGYAADAKWVVSGDMLELGKDGEYFHKALGEEIARSGIKGLVTFGELSKATFAQAEICGMAREYLWHCKSHKEAADILKKVAKTGDAVLVKGSRAMKMEEVIKKLEDKG